MSFFKLPRLIYRRIRAGIRYMILLPRSLNLVELAIEWFSFPQHDWAKRIRSSLSDEQYDVGWRQAINPINWFIWSVRFLSQWTLSRPCRTLAPAIPAMLVALLLGASVIDILRRDTQETQADYLEVLRTSLRSGDTDVAAVAAQRLLALDPENLEHQYQVAMLDDKLGKSDAARVAIFRLAVQKEYGPAALWALRSLIYEDQNQEASAQGQSTLVRRTQWSPDEEKLFHRCATVAITKLPSQRALYAKRLYASFLADSGYSGDALRLYEDIAEFDPEVNLAAALLAEREKDYATSRRFARAAIRFLGPAMVSSPADVSVRLHYAQALVLDEQDDKAFDILVDGLRMSPNSEVLAQAAGEALIFKSSRLKRNIGEEETLLKRAQILIEAIKLAPKSPLVIETVVQVAIECGEADSEKLDRVREALLQGVTPAAMHFVEGTVLLMAGENQAAQHHLELAAKEGGNMAGLLNNLAVALGQSGEQFLPKALRFSNEALRQMPDHPYLLETRGQILLRLHRYRDAIADLEGALKDPAMRPLAHAGLATAYEALGVDDLAEDNRTLAERYAPSAVAQ